MSSAFDQLPSPPFGFMVSTLPAWPETRVALAASRSGAIGLLNLENVSDPLVASSTIAQVTKSPGPCGVKLDASFLGFSDAQIREWVEGLDLVVLTAAEPDRLRELLRLMRSPQRKLLLEATCVEEAKVGVDVGVDGIIAKGHEAGGRVGDETTFILLQRFLSEFQLPVWARGGIGEHSAAACFVAGAAGVVLDNQVLLTTESRLPHKLRAAVERMEGDETVCLGAALGSLYRVYKRPGMAAVEELQRLEGALAESSSPLEARERWQRAIRDRVGWARPESNLWPLGQDAAFAASLARRFRNVAGILAGLRQSIVDQARLARRLRPLDRGAPLARSQQTEFPILQGPMTRVSDTAAFAAAVAEGGALPFLALALMRGPEVRTLLEETQLRLGPRSWGVGILGFVPPDLRSEQLEVVREFCPPFALIAGGRPDQSAKLERNGIATYLHVPAPGLLRMFLEDGARRFVFEGKECGGHVGPRTSFVLWQTMIDVLLEAIEGGVRAEELHAVFAAGIHDARSAAMVAAMAAPLAKLGARVGVLLGTGYLFTEEAVRCGAVVEGFQQEAIRCERTVLLESGPGHSIRCADTPFFQTFLAEKRKLGAEKKPPEEVRASLEKLNLGRLRIASKGIVREARSNAGKPRYVEVAPEQQQRDGMYMIGQLAALRKTVSSIRDLHEDVSAGSTRFLDRLSVSDSNPRERAPSLRLRPCDVAIVGMGCLLPGAPNVAAFWRNILNKVDAIQEIPKQRFPADVYYDPDRKARDKIYSKWGGFLDDVPFDPMRYGIPPNALTSIDPLQLLSLEVVRQALEDAGYLEREFARERTAVILGISGGLGDLGLHYGFRASLPMFFGETPAEILDRLPEWTEDSFAGILPNVAAGRVANRFNLGGVNFTVDAACASSLAAVYLARHELEAGTSDMVLVGGVDTVQSPFGFLCFSKSQALSPRGRCSPFDESADGIAISEGLAVLVLKRREDAERDGDRIYAVIKSVAGSSDGRGKGLTAPRPEGQVRALERAYQQADVSAASIGLIEAHGTGTVAGDAAEVAALAQVFRSAGARPGSCAIGSVKSMLGHTKSAAGVTGLMKVALALYHRVLPPTLHVTNPNSKLREPGSPFYVNVEPSPWISTSPATPRRGGVSAFGFGGTNFHTVVEEYLPDFADPADKGRMEEWPSELFVWNATAPSELMGRLEIMEKQNSSLSLRVLAASLYDEASSPHAGGPEPRVRLAIIASSLEDLRSKLRVARNALQAGKDFQDSWGVYLVMRPCPAGKLAFLFPGQGSQYPGMLRDLALYFPEIRYSVEAAHHVLADKLSRPLSSYVFPPPAFGSQEEEERMRELTDTQVAQPALGAVELGLHRLLERLGVHADLVAGHSYGEYVALCAGGAITQAQLFELSELRGRLIKDSVRGHPGTMASVGASGDEVAQALGSPPGVWLANFNAPRQTVIAGRPGSVQDAIGILESKGFMARSIPVACAFHSPLMEAAREQLAAALSRLNFASPRIDVFSNSTASAYPTTPEEITALLGQHLVCPVRFLDEVRAMYEQGARIFLEVGPRSVLTGLARQILEGRDVLAIPIDASDRNGVTQLLQALGQMTVRGLPVNLEALFESRSVEKLNLEQREQAQKTSQATAWVVNGAGARLRSEPLQRKATSGVLASRDNGGSRELPEPQLPSPIPAALGQGKENHAKTSPAAGEAGRSSHRPAPSSFPVPSGPSPKRGHDDRPRGATQEMGARPDDLDAVMLGFQKLMSQFLKTQAAVMTGYLQGEGKAKEPVSRPLEPEVVALASGLPGAGVLEEGADKPAAGEVVTGWGVVEPSPREEASSSQRDIAAQLLQIVCERTGYPTEMLDLDFNIEADLGIDSIKRVEILSAFQRLCRSEEQSRIQAGMEKLTSLKTLRQLAESLGAAIGDGGTPQEAATHRVPQAVALETSVQAAATSIPRFTLTLVETLLEPGRRKTYPGRVCVITEDERGIAENLASELREARERPVRLRLATQSAMLAPDLYTADLANPESVKTALEMIRKLHGPIGAVVHLLPLRPGVNFADLSLDDWRKQLKLDIGSLYALARFAGSDLSGAGREGGAMLVAATAMGGTFASQATPRLAPTHAGVAALIRTVALEWPEVRSKVVDFDTSELPSVLKRHLLAELTSTDDTVQVGYRGERRVTLVPSLSPLNGSAGPTGKILLSSEMVFLLTGGARGITAEIASYLAKNFQPTLILAGLSPLPADEEPGFLAGLSDPQQLKLALAAHLRDGGKHAPPATVNAAFERVLKDREIRRNLLNLRRSGAQVEYYQVEVRDERALGGLIDEIYRKHKRIDGVIHGAGIIEDKLIVDKSSESFERVLHTKADSAFILTRKLRPESLRLLVFMSSAAAVFGNPGQGDYAAANGVLNGLAALLSAEWPGRVVAMNWGPWDQAGMVSEEVRNQFLSRGIQMIPPVVGSEAAYRDMASGGRSQPIVVLGDGPWSGECARPASRLANGDLVGVPVKETLA